MFKQRIKMLALELILLIGLSGCDQKPVINIDALASDMKSESLALPQIQATLSDQDWIKLQGLLPIILPRLLGMEAAVLWLPQGTMLLSAQTAVMIQSAEALNERSQTLIELTEQVLEEAQKTREAIELMIKAAGAKK